MKKQSFARAVDGRMVDRRSIDRALSYPCVANEGEEGNLIAEFALVLPVIFFLVFASLEFARVLDRYQWATQLSREVASIAYRQCSAKREPWLQLCLREEVFGAIDLQLDQFAPGVEFIVQVYAYDNDAAVPTVEVLRYEPSQTGSYSANEMEQMTGISRVSLRDDISGNRVGSPGVALRENEVLVVAHAFLPYTQLIGGVVQFVINAPLEVSATTLM